MTHMSMLWYYLATAAALFQMCDALKSKKQWELQCKYQFHPMKRRVLNGSNSNRRKWRRRNIILQSNDHPLYVQHLQNVSLSQKYYILSSCSHINYLDSLPIWDSCFFCLNFPLVGNKFLLVVEENKFAHSLQISFSRRHRDHPTIIKS